MSFTIRGIGTAVPTCPIPQERAARCAQVLCNDPAQASLVPVLYRQTEIEQRYFIVGDEVVDDVINGTRHSRSIFLPSGEADDPGPTTSQRMHFYVKEALPLAVRAARGALEDAEIDPEQVTHLVTVSCTGFSAPGVDIGLIKQLGLLLDVERTNVGFMGCHGALNGLRVARALTADNPDACVLLCAVELCGIHFRYGWDPKRVVSNALFGDGAAALVGTADGPPECWRVAANGAGIFPDSEFAMTWIIGNNGFDMTLATKVPNLIATNLKDWLGPWLARHDLRIEDIASWCVHPGGPRVLNSVCEALGLEREATNVSREVLARHGNMSSPTVLFILDRLRQEGAPRPCVAMGFGPGLAVEAALFE